MASPVDAPSRATTFDADAIPEHDPNTTAGLLAERLQAWKHAVVYLEEYCLSVEKIHRAQSKEWERALKTIANPLREGHHFDGGLNGIAGFFENLRLNTQTVINTNLETEKNIKGSVLPVLERLHKEIKHKTKELSNGPGKGAKEVEKARNVTQKHIELLGQQAAMYESAPGRITAHEDPYLVRRGVAHRLHKQVLEENNHRNDLLATQANFATFEAHVVTTLQGVLATYTQIVGQQASTIGALHTDILGAVQRVGPNFEWNAFTTRVGDRLISPDEAPRAVEGITFPNMSHAATVPVIEGNLERKSRNKLSWGYTAGHYVVTPAKYLHGFKDVDDARTDPKPEVSIHLPDAVIGSPSGDKFTVKGKDSGKSFTSKLAGTSELSFKASSDAEAIKWYEALLAASNSAAAAAASPTQSASPASPAGSAAAPLAIHPAPAPAATPAVTEAADTKPPAITDGQESGVIKDDKPAEVAAEPAAPVKA